MATQREVTSLAPPVTVPEQHSTSTSAPAATSASTSTSIQQSSTTMVPADANTASHPLSTTSRESGEGMKVDSEPVAVGPMVHVRALIISGQSHVFSFEPETTVGRTKELIWSMWPSDWTSPAQPPSPSFLRILHAGRVLQDDSTLVSNNLPTATSPSNPTVIHISVRSFSIRAEDDPKKGNNLGPSRTRSRGGAEEVGGCKCTIM